MKTKWFVAIWLAVMSFCADCALGDTWESLNYPDSKSTRITDIDGTKALGQYLNTTDNYQHTFLYDTTAKGWLTIDPLVATGGAWPKSISGDKVVGSYNVAGQGVVYHFLYEVGEQKHTALNDCVPGIDSVAGVLKNSVVGAYWDTGIRHGFLYDPDSQILTKSFDPPGSMGTYPVYSSGTQLVGSYYDDSGAKHNFLYDEDSRTFTTIDMPGMVSQLTVYPTAVDNGNVIGNYQDGSNIYGFLYDGKDWLTLNYPGSLRTNVSDISGSSIVGQYTADDAFHTEHSFLYDILTKEWTCIDVPGAKYTQVTAIDGLDIVGYYHSSPDQGFLYTIPEPTTLVLLVVSGGMVLLPRCKSAISFKRHDSSK